MEIDVIDDIQMSLMIHMRINGTKYQQNQIFLVAARTTHPKNRSPFRSQTSMQRAKSYTRENTRVLALMLMSIWI